MASDQVLSAARMSSTTSFPLLSTATTCPECPWGGFLPLNENATQKKTYYYVDTSSYGRTAKLSQHPPPTPPLFYYSRGGRIYGGSRRPPSDTRSERAIPSRSFPISLLLPLWPRSVKLGGAGLELLLLYLQLLLVNPATKKVLLHVPFFPIHFTRSTTQCAR